MSELLAFWFSPDGEKLWFNATLQDDKMITEKFSKLISHDPKKDIPTDKLKLLENILIYDQIIRHVYRNDKDTITRLGEYAFKLSLHILDKGLDKEYMAAERCFVLLPLRHTFDLKYVQTAFGKVLEYMEEDPENKYYLRFYKATILSLSKIKTPLIEPEPINGEITDETIFKTLDPICTQNLYEIKEIDPKEPIYQAFRTTLKKIKGLKEVTLSLSGGVDSMSSSFVLYHLSKELGFKFIANSVNYNNREDNIYEMEFIKRWCKLLGIPHYIKNITELTRNRSYNRDLYEKVTKKLRFDLYKRFGNPVILGHNRDDSLENIFNNIKKTRSYNNLKGMSEFCEENGLILVRPMLNITKEQIREFAKKYLIPHLPNSTPSWSERGRIRDELIPFLNNFESGLIPGFLKLADNMREVYDIYDKSVVISFFEKVQFSDSQVTIPLQEEAKEKKYGFIFWKDIILRIFKKLEFSLPSNKSIRELVKRIEKNSYGLINLSKTMVFKYDSNNLILYL